MFSIALQRLSGSNKNVIIVCPTIVLVHQLIKNLSDEKYQHLLEENEINEGHIIGVCSKTTPDAPSKVFSHLFVEKNLWFNHAPHLFIFCGDSWQAFLTSNQANLLKNLDLIIFDESHLQKTIISETRKVFPEKSFHYYSATPGPVENEDNQFTYLREKGIEDRYLSELYVDHTFPPDWTYDDLVYLIQNQDHPSGGKLLEHKGIIYVDSIDSSKDITQKLKALGIDVFEIHSKITDYSEDIEQFKKMRCAIAVAVYMLQEGYDDSYVDYAIFAKKGAAHHETLIQTSGRVLRLGYIGKIGYFITFSKYADWLTTCVRSTTQIKIASVSDTLLEKIGHTKHHRSEERDMEDGALRRRFSLFKETVDLDYSSDMEPIDSDTEMKVTDVWKSRYRENFSDSTGSMSRKGP